ncbi:DUF2589 domain-containing protein [Thalassomonas viridans]|uniref:DUF2589 domain-containing protein n=1 Tax=Thalassomonas viridans TaxID=137584 RepID=A0AAE9Z767_9GAMM|nr:DUF2589 domain-containing protein [Thalassomonas viridans]WDE06533.1 DUF2589 domain-containing protein [Thalassomonas viridans]
MAGELVQMSDQFQGLPMDTLIGGPLTAACDAQVMLAKATSDFITDVGFDEQKKVRMVDFSFSKPEHKENPDGTIDIVRSDYEVSVPFISIVSVPTLQVDNVDVSFNMEVKSSFSESKKSDRQAAFSAEGGGRIGPFSVKVKVSGSVSSSSATERKSDNSAKYGVQVTAKQTGTPEGLSRVMDILQQSIAPVPKGAAAATDSN